MKGKVVIIGSGLGGLSCGVILAKNGYQVVVLEKNSQPGGCLQCFTRRGVQFETGMHFIGSAGPGQTLDKLMNYLEISKDVQLSELDPSGYDVVLIDGKCYKFAKGRKHFIDQMTSYFPNQRVNLERYFDLVEKVANASSLHSLKYADSDSSVNTEYQLRSINNVIDEVITDPILAKVLVGNLPLYAAEKDKTPFSTHAFIMDFYNQSAYRIVGGSGKVANSMIHTIEKYGGEVLTNHAVTKIICGECHAVGVEVNHDKFISADFIISDAHPMRTLEMLDTKLIRPAFRNRINSIRQTIGSFTVYLHFKEKRLPYMNYNLYGYNGNTPWGCEDYNDSTWPKGYLYMHFCQENNPKYATTGAVLSYMHIDDLEKWKDTTVGNRGSEYESFKKKKAEILLDSLEKQIPGLKDSIKYYYTSTPLTYRDYTGTEEGSMYGVSKDVNSSAACRVPHRTRIPNVYQTGQNINSHGMLGVLVGTIVTCSELISAEAIYRQIIDAYGKR